MDCQEMKYYFYLYLDGELDKALMGEVKEHLVLCWECGYLFRMESHIRQGLKGTAYETKAPGSLKNRLKNLMNHEFSYW
jgi:anti-sigma factor (TIGR02949 family)